MARSFDGPVGASTDAAIPAESEPAIGRRLPRSVRDERSMAGLREYVCTRCGTSLPGSKLKDLWNLGWRPAEIVGPPTRQPLLTCPACLGRR